MAETHIITIATDGTPTIEVKGVKGKSCQDATKDLERALGATVSDKKTGEFYEREEIATRNKQ